MKLLNLLKELILEAKQVGNLYHFTPIYYCIEILKSQYIQPNDENQISTTRYANSNTGFISHSDTNIMCRIMLDGDKVSNKYKIRGYVHPSDIDTSYGDDKNLDYEKREDFLKRKGAKGKYAEEGIETKGQRFYLLPYIKRIDIFIEGESNKKEQKYLETLKELLDKMNIPYKTYQGTPKSNTPYNQPKEGDPSQFTYKPFPKPNFFSLKSLELPWKGDQVFTISPNIETYPVKNDNKYLRIPFIFNDKIFSSPDIPDYYIINRDFNIKYFQNEPSEKNRKGSDYSSPITQEILKSLDVKDMKELGFGDIIKKLYGSLNIPLYKEITRDSGGYGEIDDYQIKNINTFLDKKITLIPKDILDKYFIKSPSLIDNNLYKRKGILKK
jgi:hypothetical protein